MLLVAAAMILGGVVVVALGRGGELASFPADAAPFDAEIVTAADVVLLRPPSALFGYNRQVTDDAFSAIARIITDRDVEIATLRRQLSDLQTQAGPRGPADPRPAAGGLPPPGQRRSAVTPAGGQRSPSIRRGLAGPGRPPQTWSAWKSATPGEPTPAAHQDSGDQDSGGPWGPDPGEAQDVT